MNLVNKTPVISFMPSVLFTSGEFCQVRLPDLSFLKNEIPVLAIIQMREGVG